MVNRITAAMEKARARAELRDAGSGAVSGSGPESGPATKTATGTGAVARLPLPAVDEAWAALPAHVPNARHLARNLIVTREAGDAAMPFDILRTRMLKEMRSHGWRRVAITSPDAGCGKSTLAANLALSFARQSELRSLLLEVDLRRPSLAQLLGLTDPPPFARALAGEIAPEAALTRIGSNLAVGAGTAPVRGATEMLQHQCVGEVLERIEQRLAPAVMLFDLPPLMRSDDAIAFLDKVDCALLVVEAEVTPLQDIDLSEQELARNTAVLGVVINKLQHNERPYGYG